MHAESTAWDSAGTIIGQQEISINAYLNIKCLQLKVYKVQRSIILTGSKKYMDERMEKLSNNEWRAWEAVSCKDKKANSRDTAVEKK